MTGKKLLVALIALALLLTVPGVVSAQYQDEITDPRGDVSHYRITETGYTWRHNVDRPDVDIRAASIREEAGDIIVSLEVEGNIRSASNFWYHIYLEDGEGQTYSIHFETGNCWLHSPYYSGNLEYSGVGTNTFQTSFPLEEVGHPTTLSIVEVYTWEWTEDEGTGEYYWDTAGPEADDPANGDDDTDNGDEDFDGVIDDLVTRGMWCLAIVIIVPIIVVIIIIVVLIKFLNKDDKDDKQPPQQQDYQQPPPQQTPPQYQQSAPQQQQPPPPPQNQQRP